MPPMCVSITTQLVSMTKLTRNAFSLPQEGPLHHHPGSCPIQLRFLDQGNGPACMDQQVPHQVQQWAFPLLGTAEALQLGLPDVPSSSALLIHPLSIPFLQTRCVSFGPSFSYLWAPWCVLLSFQFPSVHWFQSHLAMTCSALPHRQWGVAVPHWVSSKVSFETVPGCRWLKFDLMTLIFELVNKQNGQNTWPNSKNLD